MPTDSLFDKFSRTLLLANLSFSPQARLAKVYHAVGGEESLMWRLKFTVVCPHCLHEEECMNLEMCSGFADGWSFRCVGCGKRVYFGMDIDGTVLWTRKMVNNLAATTELRNIHTPFKCVDCGKERNGVTFVLLQDSNTFALCPTCGGATAVNLDSEGSIEGNAMEEKEQEQAAENFYIQQLCTEIGILNAQLDCMKKEVCERQARISGLSDTVARLESMLARFRRSVKDGN